MSFSPREELTLLPKFLSWILGATLRRGRRGESEGGEKEVKGQNRCEKHLPAVCDGLTYLLTLRVTYAYRVTCTSCCMASHTATVTVSSTAISSLKTFSSTSVEASSWPTLDWPERSASRTALSPTRFNSLIALFLSS